MRNISTPVLVVGAGLGGIAAALACLQRGHRVVITEPTDWIGGQLTSQLVPLDEHRRIEDTGANASYRRLRQGIRDVYRRAFPLTDQAGLHATLNPGAAWVSPLSHDPRVGLAVLKEMLLPYEVAGRVQVLLRHQPVSADLGVDRIEAVTFRELDTDGLITVDADYVIDASELGDVLELGGVEHRTGRESHAQTGEPNAPATADPLDMQSVTWCFAVDHIAGANFTIDRPENYEKYRNWKPPAWGGNNIIGFAGPLETTAETRKYWLDINPDDDPFEIDTDHRNLGSNPELWTYRRISARRQFIPGAFDSDVTIVNWPMNDYVGGPLFGTDDAAAHWAGARDLSLSLLYWLQTEAPRTDGGTGYPGLRLRSDVAGTKDGLAKMPYIRESRRILALKTILEHEISSEIRGDAGAVTYDDTVGVGHYYWIDRHAGTGGRPSSASRPHPFQIPLKALIPVRVRNVVAGAKNIGTTQITNGSYRLHPVEWSIGEAAGHLVSRAIENKLSPHQIADCGTEISALQHDLRKAGAQLHWAEGSMW